MSKLAKDFKHSADGINIDSYAAGDAVKGEALKAAKKQGLLADQQKADEPAADPERTPSTGDLGLEVKKES